MDSTAAIIESASRGDPAACAELLVRYLPQLEAFISVTLGRRLATVESVADLVQSTCREVLEDVSTFEYRGELAFKRFLFLQARRKIIGRARYHQAQRRDIHRRSQTDDEVLERALITLLTPQRTAAGKDAAASLARSVRDLPGGQRQILVLCRGFGLTPAEAAEELGIQPEEARVRLHRALASFAVKRDALRRRLDVGPAD